MEQKGPSGTLSCWQRVCESVATMKKIDYFLRKLFRCKKFNSYRDLRASAPQEAGFFGPQSRIVYNTVRFTRFQKV